LGKRKGHLLSSLVFIPLLKERGFLGVEQGYSYLFFGLFWAGFYANSSLRQVNPPPPGFSLRLADLYPSILPNIGRPKTKIFVGF